MASEGEFQGRAWRLEDREGVRQSFGKVGGEMDQGLILGCPGPAGGAGCPGAASPGARSVLLSVSWCGCGVTGARGPSQESPLHGERTQKRHMLSDGHGSEDRHKTP